MFSNVPRFSLRTYGHCIRVWRIQGQQSQLAFVLHRHITISPGMMVREAISYQINLNHSTYSLKVHRQDVSLLPSNNTTIMQASVGFLLTIHGTPTFQKNNIRSKTSRMSLHYIHVVLLLFCLGQ